LDTDAPQLNRYDLLSLPMYEADADTIHHAADRALARVRGHRPGAHAAAWAALLDELAEAKACLTDPARKSTYDTSLRKQLAGTPPTGTASAADDAETAAVNQLPDLFPPGMQPRSGPPAASPAPPQPPSGTPPAGPAQPTSATAGRTADDVSGTPQRAPRPKPPPPPAPTSDVQRAGPLLSESNAPETIAGVRLGEPLPPGPVNAHVGAPKEEKETLLPIAVSVIAVVIVITLIVACLAMYGKLGGGTSSGTRRQQPAPPTTPGKQSVTQPIQPQQQPQQPAVAASAKPPRQDVDQQPAKSIGQPQDQQLGSTAATELPETDPQTEDDEPMVEPSAQDPTAQDPTAQDPSAQDPSAQDPSAKQGPSKAPHPAPPKPAELARLSELLSAAQAALGKHEFEAAIGGLREAQELAVLPEHQALVARTRQLAEHAQGFWQTVAAVVAGFQGAEELKIGSGNLIVLVVEASPDSLTVRREGRNYSYSFREMPPGLALAIAKTRIRGDDPAGLLQLGACLATLTDRKPIYLDEARRYWLQAQAAGADVEQLLLTLTDSYDLTRQ
jgi:hypothetical protein